MKLRKIKNSFADKELRLCIKITRFFNINISNKGKCIPLSFYFMIGFLWSLYLHTIFLDMMGNKLQTIKGTPMQI